MKIEISEGICSILILEDEAIVGFQMEALAQDMGIVRIHSCMDAASAATALATNDIDVAVLDIRLPGSDTIGIADELLTRGVPYLFSTGSDASGLPERHRARAVLDKPFSDDDFRRAVLNVFRAARPDEPGASN